MKKTVLIALLLIPLFAFPQVNTDFEKLSRVCELWGLIKYFHPSLPGDAFDAAFAARVPTMLEAKNDQDWNKAVSEWLFVLNDPSTRVSQPVTPAAGAIKSEFTADSILVVTIQGNSFFSDYYGARDFLGGVVKQAELTNNIIFDLRRNNPPDPGYLGMTSGYFRELGINVLFGSDRVPQFKSVYRSGFKREGAAGADFYEINQLLRPCLEPGQNTDKRVCWIVNENSDLPEVALSMQAAGMGFILGDGNNLGSMLSYTNTFQISHDLQVIYRIADLVMPGGGKPEMDYIYREDENPVGVARQILLKEKTMQPKGSQKIRETTGGGKTVYPEDSFPAVGYRVLAAAKIFTVIDLFFPYREYMEDDWRQVLTRSLPDLINAKDEVEYGLAIGKMYAYIHDSHGFMIGNKGLDQLSGKAPSPIFVDWIEEQVVVSKLRNDSVCRNLGVVVGDVVLQINGVPVEQIMEKFSVYFAHSTPQAIMTDAARRAIRGPEGGKGVFTFRDQAGKIREIELTWSEQHQKNFNIENKSLNTIALLPGNIGYADLTRMEPRQTDEMFEQFRDTKAIIFDMRGYPRGTAWSIAPRLTEKSNIPVALFRRQEVLTPKYGFGELATTVTRTESTQVIAPSNQWKYKGKTVMLINQDAVSQSEHTGLIFRAMANTVFIGTPTAGANGDVTSFIIPGGITLGFSGQGVWWPDGSQLQRKGLQPDILVNPTIKGLIEGKDEILDKALESLIGNSSPSGKE